MGIAKSAAGQLPANSAIKRSSREVGKWAKSTIADLYIPRKFTKLNCFHHTKKHPMPVMYIAQPSVSLEMDSQIYDSYVVCHTLCENTLNFHTRKT